MIEIEVKQSTIVELGVFTLCPVPEGTIIRSISYVREITDEAPLRSGEQSHHCTFIDDRLYLVNEPDRYYNHSCDPNTYLRYEGDQTVLVARRDIAANTELTLDYLINNAGGNSWPCNCGAKRCRGKTGYSFFTLPGAIQREYAPLLAPWFCRSHRSNLSALGLVGD